MKKILLATDGSPGSARALEAAVQLVRRTGARFHIVTVLPSIDRLARDLEAFAHSEHSSRALEDLLASVEPESLVAARKLCRAHGLDEPTCVVLRGDAAEEILSYADTWEIDLIVVGSRGRGQLKGLLLGSVSQKIGTHSRCSVLIAR